MADIISIQMASEDEEFKVSKYCLFKKRLVSDGPIVYTVIKTHTNCY